MGKKASVVRGSGTAIALPEMRDAWWGIHYDTRGLERERRSFRTRDEARAWVKEMKAKERGELKGTEAA